MKMMNAKKMLIGLSILGAVAAVGLLLRSSRPGEIDPEKKSYLPGDTRSTLRSDEKRGEGEFRVLDYHLHPGSAWRVEFSKTMKLNSPDQKKSPALGITKMGGDVTIHSVKYEKSTLSIIANISLKTLESSFIPKQLLQDFSKPKNQTRFGRVILFEIAPNGRILKAKYPELALSEAAVAISYDILTSILFTWPVGEIPPAGGKVSLLDPDAVGEKFPMDLDITSKEDSFQIVGISKVDTSKSAVAAQGNSTGLTALSEKTVECNWNKTLGLPNHLSWKGKQELRDTKTVIAGAETSTQSAWKSSGKSEFTPYDLIVFTKTFDIDQVRNRTNALALSKSKNPDDTRKTWGRIQNDLPDVSSRNKSESELAKVFDGMAEALKNDPRLLPKYMNEVTHYAPGSRQVSMLIGAMGYLGTPEAQEAMVDIYSRPKATQGEREKILMQMTLLSKPITPATKDFLKGVYTGKDTDLAKQAGFALGSSISNLPDPDLVRDFKDEFRNSADGDKKAYILQVMGNNRGDQFHAEAIQSIRDSTPTVRAMAMESLRFSVEPGSRKQLFDAIAAEKAPSVKTIGYRTLQYQPYDSLTKETLYGCVGSETLESIRKACYDVLLSHLTDTETRNRLAARVQTESSPALKRRLEDALKR
jgi:hypothetical protein